jgi:hypothetical protein
MSGGGVRRIALAIVLAALAIAGGLALASRRPAVRAEIYAFLARPEEVGYVSIVHGSTLMGRARQLHHLGQDGLPAAVRRARAEARDDPVVLFRAIVLDILLRPYDDEGEPIRPPPDRPLATKTLEVVVACLRSTDPSLRDDARWILLSDPEPRAIAAIIAECEALLAAGNRNEVSAILPAFANFMTDQCTAIDADLREDLRRRWKGAGSLEKYLAAAKAWFEANRSRLPPQVEGVR